MASPEINPIDRRLLGNPQHWMESYHRSLTCPELAITEPEFNTFFDSQGQPYQFNLNRSSVEGIIDYWLRHLEPNESETIVAYLENDSRLEIQIKDSEKVTWIEVIGSPSSRRGQLYLPVFNGGVPKVEISSFEVEDLCHFHQTNEEAWEDIRWQGVAGAMRSVEYTMGHELLHLMSYIMDPRTKMLALTEMGVLAAEAGGAVMVGLGAKKLSRRAYLGLLAGIGMGAAFLVGNKLVFYPWVNDQLHPQRFDDLLHQAKLDAHYQELHKQLFTFTPQEGL